MTTKQTRKRSTRKTARTSFGQDLIEAMQEVVAIERGTATPARVIKVPLTARKATATPAPHFDLPRVKHVRAKLKLSQPVFAKALNVSPGTVPVSYTHLAK